MAPSISIRVLTHNIRYATKSPGPHEKPWQERLPLIMNQFSYHTRFLTANSKTGQFNVPNAELNGQHTAASICLQEVLHNQLHDILTSLNDIEKAAAGNKAPEELPNGPFWSHIGVAREDGKTKGEYSPILYPTQHFTLLHFENAWLSPTPNKPSKGWDAALNRILTTGVLEHKATKRRVAVLNTHLDHAGTVAREKSIGIILNVIKRIRSEWGNSNTNADGPNDAVLDYILTGDFNSFPTQEAYQAMARSNSSIDVHEAVSARDRYGSEITFTGFEPGTDGDKDDIGRIDYIWLGPKDRVYATEAMSLGSKGWHVQGYSVLPNVFDDGVFCSDHRCVVADAILV